MKRTVLILFLLSSVWSLGAQGIISGYVSEENTNQALPGAHILLEGSSIGAISDTDGHFRLKNVVPGAYTARVSFVGYHTVSQSVEVSDDFNTTLVIQMKPGDLELDDITISASNEQSINTFSPLDIKLRPTNTSQDVLRLVPGLFTAQHAGGGKAEQIFLRGFDIDHGTDINLEVDGLPVNMVSHAHGQGYSDLHFVIPELINYVDFNKGPYYSDKGDFTTAGFVEFQTKSFLDKNFIKTEVGGFGTMRGVAGLKLSSSEKARTNGYIASEFIRTNGFVESPQDFGRFNVMSKVSRQLNQRDKLILGTTFFTSHWDASGQIPIRAVESGMISRFGSIDNTEGGNTSRANLYIRHLHEFSNGGLLSQQLYGVYYNFNLFSNFTFFLNDPVNGDQIQQKESRMIYGYRANYTNSGSLFGRPARVEAGTTIRLDDVNDISLSNTIKRKFLGYSRRGNVDELNLGVYLNETLDITDKLTMSVGARLDYFNFSYSDRFSGTDNSEAKLIASPKFMIDYQLDSRTQIYLRTGVGFHSNDARVVTDLNGKDILPRAFGVDLGITSKITEKLLATLALWRLDLEQEFVYVGDEGIVEPSGKTLREGIDLSVRYQILPWLFADGDLNLTRPRAKEGVEGNNYIPLAPTFSTIGGLTFRMKNGLNGGMRYRYLGDRAANESKSVIADGYFLADAIINYTQPKFEIGLSVENIFNVEWNEAQFYTESRLKEEVDPISEIHFTPGTPLFVKLKLCFFF